MPLGSSCMFQFCKQDCGPGCQETHEKGCAVPSPSKVAVPPAERQLQP